MLIKGPWGKYHRVNDHYDNQDVEFEPDHTFQNLTPTDLLTKNRYNFNKQSTKVDEKRGITLKFEDPQPTKLKEKRNW